MASWLRAEQFQRLQGRTNDHAPKSEVDLQSFSHRRPRLWFRPVCLIDILTIGSPHGDN